MASSPPMADSPLCRFCHESTPPLLSPCRCDGSMKYIHRSCILRWATIEGYLDYDKLVCSLCMTPYAIPEIRMEQLRTGNYGVDLALYNSPSVYIMVNYVSVLLGIHTGQSIANALIVSQTAIYGMYIFLFCRYLRIENTELYADIFFRRHAYFYWMIQLYASYSAYRGQFALMSVTAMLTHRILWNEHITTLRLVNEELVKND